MKESQLLSAAGRFSAEKNSIAALLYNMLSLAVIVLGGAFARKKEGAKACRSYGPPGFLVFILPDGVTLGTWPLIADAHNVPLAERLLRTFGIVHNAGLPARYGQLLITSTLATKYLVMAEGRSTRTSSIWEVPVSRSEIFVLIAGFLLMPAGALVKSRAMTA